MPKSVLAISSYIRSVRVHFLAGLIVVLLLAPQARASEARRPDIVFIMTDDQSFDALDGTGRFPFFRMPNVDRLAERGVRFSNAFVTTSICSPSRATCLTGLYSHKTGVPRNDPEVDPSDNLTLISEMLQKAGYETAFIGKWHMAHKDNPRRGFDYWLSFKGQGVYQDPSLNLNGTHIEVKGYTADILTDYATKWIENRSADKPFALFLWHKAPHEIRLSAERHRELFKEVCMREPANFRDSYRGKPEWQRRGLLYGLHQKAWADAEGKPVPAEVGLRKPFEKAYDRADFQEYFRTLMAVDESTGRVLDTLDKTGRRENSLIIYTSDNGFNFLAHQSGIDKRTMWEESIRIPLVIQFPQFVGAGESRSEMVINVDFAPTVLEAAGIPVPAFMDGKAVQQLVEKQAPGKWRNSFLYVYQMEGYAPSIATMVGVRTERFKYIVYPDEKEGLNELFDLKADPHEMRNVVHDPAYGDVLTKMQSEVLKLTREVAYPFSPKSPRR